MNAIDRYQEVLDTMIVGNRTGIYLSKEELQDLLDYVTAAEDWFAAGTLEDRDIRRPKWMEARVRLGLTESSPSAPKE